jgi:hypothetical protein
LGAERAIDFGFWDTQTVVGSNGEYSYATAEGVEVTGVSFSRHRFFPLSAIVVPIDNVRACPPHVEVASRSAMDLAIHEA